MRPSVLASWCHSLLKYLNFKVIMYNLYIENTYFGFIA